MFSWADATPRSASRPSRTILITRMRRSRVPRRMTHKPLHQTPSGANAACRIRFSPSESCQSLNASPRNRLRESWRNPVVFSTSPISHPTTQPTDNTYKPNQLFDDNEFLLRNSVCLQRLSGTESTDEDRADLDSIPPPLVGGPSFPFEGRNLPCMPAPNVCQRQSTVVWGGGARGVSALLGMSLVCDIPPCAPVVSRGWGD